MPFMFGIYGGAYFVHADNAKARTGYSNLDGRQIIVEGEVYRKGYKERTGLGEVPVLYLKSVHILMDSEYSERNPSKQFPKEEIENIFCYMEQEGYQEPALGTTLRLKGELRSLPGRAIRANLICKVIIG